MISVIIATYNRGQHIEEAVRSVLRQSYKNIEIIVINDGSTDNTKRILDPYIKAKKIRYIYQENTGSIYARKRAINYSQGKYIAILDSDDIWCDQDKLKKQVEFLEKHPDYVLTGGSMIKIDKSGEEIARYIHPENDEDIREAMLFGNMFTHSTVVFRKDTWKRVNGYGNNDWNLWLKLGRVGKLYNFQDHFVYYLENGQNTSHRKIRKSSRLDIKLIKKYRNDYPNFRKAFILALVSYLYSFFPFKEQLHPIILKFKK